MKPVYQVRLHAAGDCFAACVASIFEIPLEEAFDPFNVQAFWTSALIKWLNARGFDVWYVEKKDFDNRITHYGEKIPPDGWRISDYMIGDARSVMVPGGRHAVVCSRSGQVVHDPNPLAEAMGEVVGYYLLLKRVAA